MSKFYGVDVSSNNLSVDWKTLKEKYNIKCAMIRAGFGDGTADTRVVENIKGCKDNGIKYGLYWFSYALNEKQAINEANLCCAYATKYGCDIGVAYDWEYDSERYANTQGVTITNDLRVKFATAFLERVKALGYDPILYTNLDYLVNRGLNAIRNKYKLWLAEWDVATPDYDCKIWQYKVSNLGSLGEFDLNVFYDINGSDNIIPKIIEYIGNEQYKNYLNMAFSVIGGKYGTGEARKKKIRSLGYDYEMVQELVNYILSSKEHLNNYFIEKQYKYYERKAKEIKNKITDKTKAELNSKGYDFEITRALSKLI